MRRIRFVLWGLLVTCCASCPDAFSRNKKGEDGPRVVFIGDSITDGNWGCVYHYKKTSAERSQTDLNHIYGHTYMSLVATWYETRHPRAGYQFYNRGISGHKLADLANRWKEDVLDLHPDVVSVLVGVNDTLFEKLIRRQPRPSYWIWDGIHPTPAGHRKMAECWLRHVRLCCVVPAGFEPTTR